MDQMDIAKVMTPSPHTIGVDQSVADAQKIMRRYHVRHLPVLNGGQLVGIVSDRDLACVENIRGIDLDKLAVDDIMSSEVFFVCPSAALERVVSTMTERKYGAVVIMDGAKVVGIFTTIDALRLLNADLASRRLSSVKSVGANNTGL